MKNILLFILLICISIADAQERKTPGQVGSANDVVGGFFRKSSFAVDGKVIEGSRFLLPNWQNQGEIYAQGKLLRLTNLNLDLSTDEFSQMKQNDSIFIFEKSRIDSVKINNRLFKPNQAGKVDEILSEGENASLIKNYEVEIIEGMFNPTDGTTKPSRYKIIENYAVVQNGIAKKVSLNKKNLADIFGNDKGAVEKYIKDNKLSYKDESDMIRVFNYYNTL
ncbi:MAG: hypothetical protein WBN19_10145 [Lutimonas sp.]